MLVDRLNALLWTCALELPVYAWWMRGRFAGAAPVVGIALGLQCLTQPLLWEYTARNLGDVDQLLLAEAVVWCVEAVLLYGLLRRLASRPLTMTASVAAAGSANLLSVVAGVGLNHLLYG